MKKINLLLAFLAIAFFASFDAYAQKELKSPPAKVKGEINGVKVEVNYHQPSAKGRKVIDGDLVPYGKIWRTGANNATTISFDQDITIEGNKLAKGTYSLFTIPDKNEWVIIFNKTPNQWGAYNYDKAEDALRVNVKPGKTAEFIETFNIDIQGNEVVLSWENTKASFKVDK